MSPVTMFRRAHEEDRNRFAASTTPADPAGRSATVELRMHVVKTVSLAGAL